jgi:hypothetical protein
VKTNQAQPPTILYCRHDQFEQSAARAFMPVEPRWLIAALGLVTFGPEEVHTGPTVLADGRLQISSTRQTSGGLLEKTTIIDQGRAWVLQQNVYLNGSLVATATASDHRFDATTGVSLPRRIAIQIPSAQPVSSLSVDLGSVVVNQLMGNPAELWAMPQDRGVELVNLAEVIPRQSAPAAVQTPPMAAPPLGLGYPPQAALPATLPPITMAPPRLRY